MKLMKQNPFLDGTFKNKTEVASNSPEPHRPQWQTSGSVHPTHLQALSWKLPHRYTTVTRKCDWVIRAHWNFQNPRHVVQKICWTLGQFGSHFMTIQILVQESIQYLFYSFLFHMRSHKLSGMHHQQSMGALDTDHPSGGLNIHHFLPNFWYLDSSWFLPLEPTCSFHKLSRTPKTWRSSSTARGLYKSLVILGGPPCRVVGGTHLWLSWDIDLVLSSSTFVKSHPTFDGKNPAQIWNPPKLLDSPSQLAQDVFHQQYQAPEIYYEQRQNNLALLLLCETLVSWAWFHSGHPKAPPRIHTLGARLKPVQLVPKFACQKRHYVSFLCLLVFLFTRGQFHILVSLRVVLHTNRLK